MKTNLFTVGLVFASAFMLAQTPRLSLYEEFTGETCPPCATTNPGLNAKLSAPTATPLVVAIKWQVPIPSAPANSWSLYKTNKVEIDWRYRGSPAGYGYPSLTTPTNGINSAPSGRFDGRHQTDFGALSNHPTYVTQNMIATAQSYTSAFSIVMAKKWDLNRTALTVTVDITATAPFTAVGPLVFRAVMIETVIQFSVQPGTNGETKFESPVIASFPSIQAGTSMAGTWVTGQKQTFVLNCPIPAYTRDVNKVDMVGFIQDDGNRRVAQAVRACSFIEATSLTNEICAGESLVLTGTGATDYTWSTGDIGENIVVSPTSNTTYWVESNEQGSCGNRSTLTVSVSACTGLNALSTNNQLTEIFPNPNKGDFLIKAPFANATTRVVIYNTLGQKVFEQNLPNVETSLKTNLSKGLYNFEVLQASEKVSTGKLIVE
jgi:hypothetical protein